jgi:DNA-binding transcriptional regulator YiaG
MPARTKAKRGHRKPRYEWDAEKVKALREHMGLTQAELAGELGTAQQTISLWERGNHYPTGISVKMLNLIAERTAFKYGEAPKEAKLPLDNIQ